MNLLRDLYDLLSRWSTAITLLLIAAVAMAGATLLEATVSTEAAQAVIYKSWWFNLILILLVMSFVRIAHRHALWQRHRWGALLLHYSFAIILIGALITHFGGREGMIHIREGERSDLVLLNDGGMQRLPFSIFLNRFTMERYNGSEAPSSYQSDVTLSDASGSERLIISMNRIARKEGYRLYQSSFDPDEQGTILAVNHDPIGMATTYVGYALLLGGLLIAPFDRGSRMRLLYRKLQKPAALILLLLATATTTMAAPTTLDRESARTFGQLLTLSSDGRIEPMNSYSSEVVRKLYHHTTYDHLSADEVLAGIVLQPSLWHHEPIIYLGRIPNDLRNTLPSGKYASYADFFGADGHYILQHQIDEAMRTPASERSKREQTLIKIDEKVRILYRLFAGQQLPIFPTGSGRWLSPADINDSTPDLPAAQAIQYGTLWHNLHEAVAHDNHTATTHALTELLRVQRVVAPHIDQRRIAAELFYNSTDLFRWAFRLYLLLGGALLIVSLFTLQRPRRTLRRTSQLLIGLLIGVFVAHTAGMALRGYICGHAPWSNAYETMIFVGWATLLSGLLFARRSALALALGALLGGVALFVSNLNWLDPQITPLVPVLKSAWLMIHVSVITASYGFFGICAVCGMASLTGTICRRDLDSLRIINEMAMIIGVILLTIGIFFGAVWANQSWGRYWGWDPKETWALITLFVYAVVTHYRFTHSLHTNTLLFDVLSVISFSTVLMTFFGVNYLLSGLHSYGRSEGLPASVVWIALSTLTALIVAAVLRHKEPNA